MHLQVKEKIKGQIPILLLLFNSFSWYFFGRLIIAKLLVDTYVGSLSFLLEATYPISIMVSAFIGALFFKKVRRPSFLLNWFLFGVVASVFLAVSVLPTAKFGDIIISSISIILGCSLGFGMPALLSYFTEGTPIENRGKIGGLAFSLVMVSAPFALIILDPLDFVSSWDVYRSLMFLAIWRGWSIPISLVSRNRIPTELQVEKKVLTRSSLLPQLFHNRAFMLYFVAWFLFSMVDGFVEPVLYNAPVYNADVFDLPTNVIELIVAGLSALFAGVIADWIGRKKIIMSGFVSLGVAYAILSISQADPVVGYFFVIADGFAIGLLWTMFTIVIWGELTRVGVEKAYAVGEAPYFLTQVVSLIFTPFALMSFQAAQQTPPVFSVAAFFLFIAVIPLLYAPETLPIEKIQERQLKIYTEEALKLKEKAEQRIR